MRLIAAASAYAATELKAWGTKGVRADSVRAAVYKEAAARDISYRKMGKVWTHRIMIDTIRDALARYALGRLVPGVGVVDFEIYCSRGSTLGLLNDSDRVDDALGRGVAGHARACSTPKLRTAEIRIRPSIPWCSRASSMPWAIPSMSRSR